MKTKKKPSVTLIPRRDYFIPIELSLRYLQQIARHYRRCCRRERDAGIYPSYIDACMHVPLHMHETRTRGGPYTGYISGWKKSGGNLHENSTGKGKGRDTDTKRGYIKHKGGGNFFSSWSRPRERETLCSLYDYFKDIPCMVRVLTPRHTRARMIAQPHISSLGTTVSTYPWLMRLLWLFARIVLINGAAPRRAAPLESAPVSTLLLLR